MCETVRRGEVGVMGGGNEREREKAEEGDKNLDTYKCLMS